MAVAMDDDSKLRGFVLRRQRGAMPVNMYTSQWTQQRVLGWGDSLEV